MFKQPPASPAPQMQGENLSKLALTRAILGRMPGEKQPGSSPVKPERTSLSKPKKF